jgi:Protein of unknwon function (DUF3310)
MSAVDHPKHYAHKSGVEAIEICEQIDFVLGNAIKYLFRVDKKDGTDGLTDLKKAEWYLNHAVGKPHRIGVRLHDEFPIMKVIEHEPHGSVLRDVLELVVVKLRFGEPPRIADALARVEREIAARSA